MLDTKARELKVKLVEAAQGPVGARGCGGKEVQSHGVRGEGGAITQNPCRFLVDPTAGRTGTNQGGG